MNYPLKLGSSMRTVLLTIRWRLLDAPSVERQY